MESQRLNPSFSFPSESSLLRRLRKLGYSTTESLPFSLAIHLRRPRSPARDSKHYHPEESKNPLSSCSYPYSFPQSVKRIASSLSLWKVCVVAANVTSFDRKVILHQSIVHSNQQTMLLLKHHLNWEAVRFHWTHVHEKARMRARVPLMPADQRM